MKTIKAQRTDKGIVIDILCQSFINDPHINYIIGDSGNKEKRLKRLMSYAFEYSYVNGKIELSDDKKAVSIWKNPASKKMTFRLFIENILFFLDFGWNRLSKISEMERIINKNYPKSDKYEYLWFIGTLPTEQGKGYGSSLLNSSILNALKNNKEIFLETSTKINLSYYSKKGFELYNKVFLNEEHSFPIYMMKFS
jgi:GNAT superfamily N-acetyltransferase